MSVFSRTTTFLLLGVENRVPSIYFFGRTKRCERLDRLVPLSVTLSAVDPCFHFTVTGHPTVLPAGNTIQSVYTSLTCLNLVLTSWWCHQDRVDFKTYSDSSEPCTGNRRPFVGTSSLYGILRPKKTCVHTRHTLSTSLSVVVSVCPEQCRSLRVIPCVIFTFVLSRLSSDERWKLEEEWIIFGVTVYKEKVSPPTTLY